MKYDMMIEIIEHKCRLHFAEKSKLQFAHTLELMLYYKVNVVETTIILF